MDEASFWPVLQQELDRWHTANRKAVFWLRDDDAAVPTMALDRLISITKTYDTPTTLAVVPAQTNETLAQRLAVEPHVSVAVHGWAHRNHADASEKKQELGAHRPAKVVLDELKQGYRLLQALFPQSFIEMLVPPWNRINPVLLPDLPDIGFRALSVFGPAVPSSSLSILNTHIDMMDWRGTRKGRLHEALLRETVAMLQSRFESQSMEPIGLLTHHLDHDDGAWDFIERFLSATTRHPAVSWKPARQLW